MIVVVKTALTLPVPNAQREQRDAPVQPALTYTTCAELPYTHTHWTTKMLLWDYAVWPREHLHHLKKKGGSSLYLAG